MSELHDRIESDATPSDVRWRVKPAWNVDGVPMCHDGCPHNKRANGCGITDDFLASEGVCYPCAKTMARLLEEHEDA